MSEWASESEMTVERLRNFKRDRIFRATLDSMGRFSDLWEKQDIRDKYIIDQVSFYRTSDVHKNPWFPQKPDIENVWYIINGAWYAKHCEDGRLWGFYHQQYHGTLGDYVEFTAAHYERVMLEPWPSGKGWEVQCNAAKKYLQRISERRYL